MDCDNVVDFLEIGRSKHWDPERDHYALTVDDVHLMGELCEVGGKKGEEKCRDSKSTEPHSDAHSLEGVEHHDQSS